LIEKQLLAHHEIDAHATFHGRHGYLQIGVIPGVVEPANAFGHLARV
jgi:hypothetical protein